MGRFLIALAAIAATAAQAAVVGEEVSYRAGDTTLKGYIAYDDRMMGKRPGILVVQDLLKQLFER